LAGTPQGNTASGELSATVSGSVTTNIPLATAYCPPSTPQKMLWKSLEGTKHDLCQPIGLVAFADFSKGDIDMQTPTMSLKNNGNSVVVSGGVSILTNTTNSLQYDWASL
jgi:hypothetical protein